MAAAAVPKGLVGSCTLCGKVIATSQQDCSGIVYAKTRGGAVALTHKECLFPRMAGPAPAGGKARP